MCLLQLFCVFFSLGVWVLRKRGGGPFSCLCPGAHCLTIHAVPFSLPIHKLFGGAVWIFSFALMRYCHLHTVCLPYLQSCMHQQNVCVCVSISNSSFAAAQWILSENIVVAPNGVSSHVIYLAVKICCLC